MRLVLSLTLMLCIGVGLFSFAQPADANAALRPLASYPAQGSGATGRVISARSNPAVLLYLLPGEQRWNAGLGQFSSYLELGPAGRLGRLAQDLEQDLAAVQFLLDQDLNALDDGPSRAALTQLARWDQQCQRFLDEQDSSLVVSCLQGATAEIEQNLILSLEEGGRFQAGFFVDVPGFPVIGRWHPWVAWSLGLSVQGQAAGRFYGDRLRGRGALEISHRGETLLSIAPQLSAETLSLTFIEFQRLSWQYANDPLSLVDPSTGAWSAEAGFLQQTLALLAQAPEGEAPLLTPNEVLQLEQLTRRLSDPSDPLFMAALRGELDFDPEALLVTHSSITTQVAELLHLYAGVSVDASAWFDWPQSWGQLDLGLRVNSYALRLSPNLVSLNGVALSQGAEQVVDRVTGELRAQQEQQWLLGVDLGLLWQDYPWQVGVTLFNVNQPTARYPRLSSFTDEQDKEAVDYLTRLDRLMDRQAYRLDRHAVLEVTFFAFEPDWVLRGHYSLDAADNLVGWSERSYGLAMSWQTQQAWVPGVRLGWRRNQVGSRLDTLHLGIDFAANFQLDLATSYQTFEFDRWRIPRYFSLGLSFEKLF
ncbi:conjugal transfer protein TraF [Marinospirillum sp. MEB164]|uniref:Conjugal transfer protein TraF n=1 Tax=Marinospirillum alkalitolerans TaxID=3123374 RepID=A0ABW8PUV5_9GAMM